MVICVGLIGLVPLATDGQDIDLKTYIEGTVIDVFTEKPLEDAMIRVWGPGWGARALTDQDGTYSIEVDVKVQDTLDVFCEKSGYYDDYRSVEIRRGDTEVVDFSLTPINSTVKGYVKDSATMEPIADVNVNLYSTEPDGEDVWTRTDDEGYFEMSAEPGYYKLICGAQNYEHYMSEEFHLDDGEVKEVEILLEEIKTGIFGSVTNEDGETLEGAVVYLYDEERSYWNYDVADEDGSYEIRAPAGEFLVSVRADDHFDYNGKVTVGEDGMTEQDFVMTKISVKSSLQFIIDLIKMIIGAYDY
ncbi:MAG: carboxypeptidase-like regulatory domain-containing protein [Candidatus Thermoplasmatota archaeon]|nr:carboxypeptidase-like regulatory domain-containing protein [Candidatus Thermoplasmatota archaeon]